MEDSVNPLKENDWDDEEFKKDDLSEVLQKYSEDGKGLSSFYNKVLRHREQDELLSHLKEIREIVQCTANDSDLYVRENLLTELKNVLDVRLKETNHQGIVADEILFDTLLIYVEDQNLELRDKAFRYLSEFLDSIRKDVNFIEQKIPAMLECIRRSRRYCTNKLYLYVHRVLAHMAYLIGPQKTEELILQPYLEFCTSPIYTNLFRRVSVMIFPTICYVMGSAYTEEKLLDKFASLCKDKACIVRDTAASYCVHMSLMCSLETRKTKMTQIVLDLAKDGAKMVLMTILLDLGKFISTLAVPCITGLVYTTGRDNEIHFPNTYLEELHVISPTMDVFRRYASPELLRNYQYYVDKYSLPGSIDKKINTTDVSTETRPKCNLSSQQISERIVNTKNRIFRYSDGFNYSLDSLEITPVPSVLDFNKTISESVPYVKDGENSWSFTSTESGMQANDEDTNTSSALDSSATAGRIIYDNCSRNSRRLSGLTTSNDMNTASALDPNAATGSNVFDGYSRSLRRLSGPPNYIIYNNRYQDTSSSIPVESITSLLNRPLENIHRSSVNIDIDSMNEDFGFEDEEEDMPEFNSHWYWNSTNAEVPLDLSLIEKKREKTDGLVPEYVAVFEQHYAREMPFSYEQSVVPPEILKIFFASIAFERRDNMKMVCASNFPAIAITLGRSNWHILRPFFRCLCGDIDSKVPKIIVSYIALLANLLGKEIARRDLVPVFFDLLKNHDDVKNEAILNLNEFLKALWFYKDELFLRILITLYQDNETNWHIINELAKNVFVLVQKFNFITSLESFMYVTSFAAHLLEDKISFNRTLGSHVLAQALRVCHQNEMEGILHFLETEYALSDNFKRRQSYVQVLAVGIQGSAHEDLVFDDLCIPQGYKNYKPRKELIRLVLPVVERLSLDNISNVRLMVARYLVKSINNGDVSSTLSNTEIGIVLRMVRRLRNDSDGVVRDLISQITESKLSEMNSIADYLEDDDDDDQNEESANFSIAQEQQTEETKETQKDDEYAEQSVSKETNTDEVLFSKIVDTAIENGLANF